ARFAGLYRGRGGDSHVVLLNQQLVIITPNAPSVDNPITLEPLGGGRFRFVAPTGGRRRWRSGAFRRADRPPDADVHRRRLDRSRAVAVSEGAEHGVFTQA